MKTFYSLNWRLDGKSQEKKLLSDSRKKTARKHILFFSAIVKSLIFCAKIQNKTNSIENCSFVDVSFLLFISVQ